jgi:nicotinic acid mononucleotide adenylyltransferase
MAKPDKKKKVKGFKEFDGSKYINTEPVLDEAKAGTVVIAWGRMNPMTAGHEMLVKKVIDVAKTEKGTPQIYLSHSQGAKSKTGKGAVNKDPLAYDDKIKFAQKAFGPIVKKSPAKTIIQLLKLLDKQFDRVVLVAGSDRVKEFNNTLNKYNGKEYKFSELKIVSAGQRDADADDVSGISGTKMRGYAKTDMKKFTANLPKKLKGDAEKIAALVNKGTQMTEESNLDEALSRQQRRKRGLAMKKARFKIARGREKAKRKTASMEVLKKRARKAAINILKTKFSKSRRYADMSAGEKEVIDKRIEKVSKQRIDAIAKKLLPKVKTAERERRLNLAKGGSSKQEEVTETTGAYFKGVEKEKRDDRERHFDRNAKKADDDASAYKPAPGDKEAKTKESKHTKKARAMGYIEELVWEDLVEGLDEAMWGQRISKKPHMLMDKNNKVKFDKRFKMYKPKVQEDLDLGDIKDLANSTEDFITEETEMRSFSQFIKEDWVCGQCSCDPCTCGEENLSEDAAGKSLKSKAEKSGMPAGVLRQVYNRGVAAWKTGHRPGTTPEQWGHARVNSFITKSSGTWGKADKDLAAKVRKEEVELDEVLDTPKAMNSYRNKAKTSKDKATNSAVANILRKGDHSADLKTRAKREKGLKMADRNATKKTVKALRGESIEEKNGLWANIHAKRARGEKMRKKGEEGAPTPEAIKRAQESFSEDLDAIMSNLDMVNEVAGAGEQGTPELTKKYKKDTPMEDKK